MLSALSMFAHSDALRAQPGHQTARASWEWDDNDRIAARMDAVAAAERVVRDEKKRGVSGKVSSEGAEPLRDSRKAIDIIDGKHDPHLFLPFELFDQLVRLGFADDPLTSSAYRVSKEEQRRQLGLPPDMWERLESMVAPYRSDRTREREITFSSLPAQERRSEAARISMLLCRDRYAALMEAEGQFGPSFKRFLYTAVAPSMSAVVIIKPDPAQLSLVNGGCQ